MAKKFLILLIFYSIIVDLQAFMSQDGASRSLAIYSDASKTEDPDNSLLSSDAISTSFAMNLWNQTSSCLVDKTILRRYLAIVLGKVKTNSQLKDLKLEYGFTKNKWDIYDVGDTSFYLFIPEKYQTNEIIGSETICIFKNFNDSQKWKKFCGKTVKNLNDFVIAGVGLKPDGTVISISKQFSTIFTTNEDLHKNSTVMRQFQKFPDMLDAKYNLVHHFFKPWVIYMAGHGFTNEWIASISVHDFPNILYFFNQLNTKFMAILSCYAGGENKKLMLDRNRIPLTLRYGLALLSIMNAVTWVDSAPSNTGLKDFFEYFNGVSHKENKKTIKEVLKKIALLEHPCFNKYWFHHRGGIAGIPQVLVPEEGWFSAIDVDPSILVLHKVAQKKGMVEDVVEVKDKLVLIVEPNIIYPPLKIETTKEEQSWWIDSIGNDDNVKKLQIEPAREIVNGKNYWHYYPLVIPHDASAENKDYYFKRIDLVPYENNKKEKVTGISHFIRNSLLNMQGREFICHFLIKELVGFNDGILPDFPKEIVKLDNVFVRSSNISNDKDRSSKILFEYQSKKFLREQVFGWELSQNTQDEHEDMFEFEKKWQKIEKPEDFNLKKVLEEKQLKLLKTNKIKNLQNLLIALKESMKNLKNKLGKMSEEFEKLNQALVVKVK